MRDDQDGSVTLWLDRLKGGDDQAAFHLWQRYFHRVVALARAKLADAPRAAVDEEDAALSAFNALCEGVAKGRFAELDNRNDLWQILVVITSRRSADIKRRQTRRKRGGGQVPLGTGDVGDGLLAEVIADGPTPETAAMLAEEYHRRLDTLGDDLLRRIAILRLEGFEHDEIAERMGCARRTIARRLELIRQIWGAPASCDTIRVGG